jgi:hypothetical protein
MPLLSCSCGETSSRVGSGWIEKPRRFGCALARLDRWMEEHGRGSGVTRSLRAAAYIWRSGRGGVGPPVGVGYVRCCFVAARPGSPPLRRTASHDHGNFIPRGAATCRDDIDHRLRRSIEAEWIVVQTGGPWDSNSIRIAVSSYNNTVREKFPQRSFWLRANGDKGSACGVVSQPRRVVWQNLYRRHPIKAKATASSVHVFS